MDTIKSFKGYGKVDAVEDQVFRRKTRKRVIILLASAVVLVAVVIGAVVGTVIHNRNSDSRDAAPSTTTTSSAASIKAVCGFTQYPKSCVSSIEDLQSTNASSGGPATDPEQIFKLSLHVVLNELSKIGSFPQNLISKVNDSRVKAALSVCQTVIDDAIDRLDDAISAVEVSEGEKMLTTAKIGNLKTWLSATITDQETCLDALEEVNSTAVLADVKLLMKNSTEFASNSLAIVSKLLNILAGFNIPIHRRLLGFGLPEWVGPAERRLLEEPAVKPDVTVAQDGSGDYRTIKEAVGKVPKKSLSRFVIHVKAGKYVENVILDKSMWNVMIYGDGNVGKTKTVISGSLNFVDGTPTFSTATFAVAGRGFIAKDIGFENTAGAEKHQAVAMRSGSDQSVFYRCSFNAFQDTLYAHSNRQFYGDCDIAGTIDFIFGNAAVVFQNCSILPRQPLPNQFVTITAQGKKDVNQNTGISIQKCTISPLDALTAPTYLGRPWKDFSTTVVMQTSVGSFLNPAGWFPWVSNVEPPSTIFYAEYQNTGPGSGVDKRVKWAGYRPTITADQASKFTVESFIDGNEWLGASNVAFESTL
ncbi:pectinesterase 3 [Diospyros lotus]|uniref:pectinesterase 3 n=1 Tax=Diospyros lotus TaxID=55363 RepID=UPI002253E404|nr:pectinesterase 3 [Diospyros lotus]